MSQTPCSGNTAPTGGGVYNDLGNAITFHSATLTGNSAATGGGLANFGTAMVDSSTLLSNSATTRRPVLLERHRRRLRQPAQWQHRPIIMTTSTTSRSSSAPSPATAATRWTMPGRSRSRKAHSPAILARAVNNAGTATIDNTIFAANTGGNLVGTAASKGFNLSDNNTAAASFTADGDQNNTAAGLKPAGLQNNGGPTLTIALAAGSPAITAGGPVYAPFEPITGGGMAVYPPFTDQRGLPRFVCGKMDIGAFQTQATTPPTIELIGGAVVTNACVNAFTDPGATAADDCGDALSVVGGGAHSVALQHDGTVVAWGDDSSGQTSVPGTLTDPVAIFGRVVAQPGVARRRQRRRVGRQCERANQRARQRDERDRDFRRRLPQSRRRSNRHRFRLGRQYLWPDEHPGQRFERRRGRRGPVS